MQWYSWHTVVERLQGRTYALTRGQPYKVFLDPTISTGCCDFTNKKILINPNLFSDVLKNKGLSGKSLDKASFLISRAITGHEALHVLYSDPKTVIEAANSPLLKTVLNLLEDARIEGIGSSTSHVSKTLFRFLNGIASSQLPVFNDVALIDRFSGLDLLLRWRLNATIPQLQPQAKMVWGKVRNLAGKALCAPACADVLTLAREIVRILGLDESENPKMPDEVQSTADRMQSDVSGSRTSDPLPNPITAPKEEQETGSADDEDRSESGDHDEKADDHEQPTDIDPEGQHNVSPESTDAIDGNVAAGRDELQDAEDIEKLVEETARRVSEDLDSIVPQDKDDCSLTAKAKPFRKYRYSDVVASPYAHYLPEAVPIAAELIRDLRAEGPRGSSGASEHPGRFRARYFVRDSSKPFSVQRFQGLSIPKMALTLVIDRSGSMEHIVNELRTMSIAITMASENLEIPLSIWALEGQVHIKRFDEHGAQILAKIAGIHADTLTRTAPTLKDAVEDLRSRTEEIKQIVLIHDGMPNDRQDFIEWKNELRGIGLFCQYIMSDDEYHAYKENPDPLRLSMDDLVGPRNYAIAPVTDIAKHWCSFIRHKLNSCARPLY